ncbi:MAG: hypothetical protein KME18_13145 [Phormidium tanganyikae FI6-MK23]|nr:hypothetical protein [Phormidium tanganyikae FI6-MK23]
MTIEAQSLKPARSLRIRQHYPCIQDYVRITSGTVRVHVHAIFHKLKVRDRTQAAVLALQKQYVKQDNSE